jgi:hypothetical protein
VKDRKLLTHVHDRSDKSSAIINFQTAVDQSDTLYLNCCKGQRGRMSKVQVTHMQMTLCCAIKKYKNYLNLFIDFVSLYDDRHLGNKNYTNLS